MPIPKLGRYVLVKHQPIIQYMTFAVTECVVTCVRRFEGPAFFVYNTMLFRWGVLLFSTDTIFVSAIPFLWEFYVLSGVFRKIFKQRGLRFWSKVQ